MIEDQFEAYSDRFEIQWNWVATEDGFQFEDEWIKCDRGQLRLEGKLRIYSKESVDVWTEYRLEVDPELYVQKPEGDRTQNVG